MGVSFRKVGFNDSNRDLGVGQYARTVVVASGLIAEVIEEDGLTYFSTEGKSAGGVKMTSFIYAFKTDDCFWVVEIKYLS